MGTRRSKHNMGRKRVAARDLYERDQRVIERAERREDRREQNRPPHSGISHHIATASVVTSTNGNDVKRKSDRPTIAVRAPYAEPCRESRISAYRETTQKKRGPSLDELKEFIVRPGIEKHLVPLLLFRGNMGLGRCQQLWNQSLLMLKSESETIGDGLKLINNPENAQLCGPHKPVQHVSMFSFFSRMRWNPKVTDNIPGLTEYVAWIMPRPFQLERVPVETPWRTRVPWRRTIPVRKTHFFEPKAPRSSDLFYPYLAYEPGSENDLIALVNNAVPKNIPEQFRADICQDMIVAILAGEMIKDEVAGQVSVYIRKVFNMFPMKYGILSFDAPAPWAMEDGRTLGEMIDSEIEHW